ncbi:MAG: hypothetical protein KF909_02090 [Rhodocyclaceae bacterium]|nr:hypothetical protein [Rhodocyclaceae bacterium]MCW5615565.1 hypothetical protein [Rhodocyclaceae bacterium]
MVLRFRRLLLVALILCVALAALSWLALQRQDAWLRPLLENMLAERLTQAVSVREAVLELGTTPVLVVRKLQVGDGARALVAIDELRIGGDPRQLASSGQVASISVSGVKVSLARDGQGRWNLATLLRPADGATPRWRIESLLVQDATVTVVLPGQDEGLEVYLARLEAGPLAPGVAGRFSARVRGTLPLVLGAGAQASLRLAGGYLPGDEASPPSVQALGLSGEVNTASARFADIHLEVAALRPADGGVALDGVALGATIQVADEPRLHGALYAPQLRLDAGGLQAATLGLALHRAGDSSRARLGLAGLTVDRAGSGSAVFSFFGALPLQDGPASASLSGRLRGGLESGGLAFERARLRARLPLAGGASAETDVALAGSMRLRPEAARTAELRFDGRFDRSSVVGRLAWRPELAVPLRLEASADRLDLDRYMPGSPRSGRETPASLPDWRTLPVALDVRVGLLRSGGMSARKARLRLVPDGPRGEAQRRAE